MRRMRTTVIDVRTFGAIYTLSENEGLYGRRSRFLVQSPKKISKRFEFHDDYTNISLCGRGIIVQKTISASGDPCVGGQGFDNWFGRQFHRE